LEEPEWQAFPVATRLRIMEKNCHQHLCFDVWTKKKVAAAPSPAQKNAAAPRPSPVVAAKRSVTTLTPTRIPALLAYAPDKTKWKYADLNANNLKGAICAWMADWSEEKKVELQSRARGRPLPLVALVEYLHNNCPHVYPDKEKGGYKLAGGEERLLWFDHYFPEGVCCFTVPVSGRQPNEAPDPLYESIQGTTIYLTRWELLLRGKPIHCVACSNGILQHVNPETTRIAEAMTPVFSSSGGTDWEFGTSYTCNKCECRIRSTDPRLIHSLPSWVTRSFPCDPQYMNKPGFFLLDRDASKLLERATLTESSADWVSDHLFESQNQHYLHLEFSYYSGDYDGMYSKFPTIDEWRGQYPPSGEQLLETAEYGARSQHTISGISDDDRHTREIQGIGSHVSTVYDHTFQVIKNYVPSLGAKALFTQGADEGFVSSAVCVDSTKIAEAAHAVEQVARRQNYNPQMIYTDTAPKLSDFFRLIFGPGIAVVLGLFHFTQRLTQHLRPNHPDYYPAIRSLRNSIYELNSEDEANVINALKDGSLNGKVHTDLDVMELRDSRKWLQRYGDKIRKIMKGGEVVKLNLHRWWCRYKVNASPGEPPGEGRLHNGLSVFMSEMKGAVENAYKTCMHIQDLLPDIMYTAISAAPGAVHGLTTWKGNRGESSLESFHLMVAHFGNMGMRRTLADSLCLRGTARHNLKLLWKLTALDKREGQYGRLPAHFRDTPLFYSHADLAAINKRAMYHGGKQRHSEVLDLEPDNGERFFSQYLLEQRERNKELGKHDLNDRCQCRKCAANPIPLPHLREAIGSNQNDPSDDLKMPMADEEEDGFAMNGEEYDEANVDDEFNDGIWSDEAFLKEIYQSELALQKPSHLVVRPSSGALADIAPNTVANMESFLLHQTINKVTTAPDPNKKRRRTRRKQSEFRCKCEREYHEKKKMGRPVHTTTCMTGWDVDWSEPI
jgi:hypothetical protein